MKLLLIAVENEGKLDSERVVIDVAQDCLLSDYILVVSSWTPSSLHSPAKLNYEFPEQNVKRGDFVFLYTGAGQDSQHENTANTTTYVYYLGVKSTLWQENQSVALLIEVNDLCALRVGHYPKPNFIPTAK